MPALLDPTALVLVVVVTQPRDMEIARLLGWYRIPFKSAPKVVAVDYLAFYQTAGFGENERWRINAIAPVRGHELTTRAELIRDEPDHPRAGDLEAADRRDRVRTAADPAQEEIHGDQPGPEVLQLAVCLRIHDSSRTAPGGRVSGAPGSKP